MRPAHPDTSDPDPTAPRPSETTGTPQPPFPMPSRVPMTAACTLHARRHAPTSGHAPWIVGHWPGNAPATQRLTLTTQVGAVELTCSCSVPPLPGHHCAANCSAGVQRASCWVWGRGVARWHMCAWRRSSGWPRIGCGSSGGTVRCMRGEGWLMLHWMGMKMTLPIWHGSSGACCTGLFTGQS